MLSLGGPTFKKNAFKKEFSWFGPLRKKIEKLKKIEKNWKKFDQIVGFNGHSMSCCSNSCKNRNGRVMTKSMLEKTG